VTFAAQIAGNRSEVQSHKAGIEAGHFSDRRGKRKNSHVISVNDGIVSRPVRLVFRGPDNSRQFYAGVRLNRTGYAYVRTENGAKPPYYITYLQDSSVVHQPGTPRDIMARTSDALSNVYARISRKPVRVVSDAAMEYSSNKFIQSISFTAQASKRGLPINGPFNSLEEVASVLSAFGAFTHNPDNTGVLDTLVRQSSRRSRVFSFAPPRVSNMPAYGA
jgi:hypothetical protein